MHLSPPFNRRLNALILLLLSFLSIATAAALPKDVFTDLTLTKRALFAPLPDGVKTPSDIDPSGPLITEEEYMTFLKKYFPDTGKYLLYTGHAEEQLKKFQKDNPGYKYYDDFYTARDFEHPWYENFHWNRMDDGDASSRAVAKLATGKIHIFGGAEYKQYKTFFSSEEVPWLHQGLKSGRLESMNHMQKDATKVDAVFATEDVDGNFKYKPGFDSTYKNAKLNCKKRDDSSCPINGKCGPGQAKIGADGECKPCPAGKVPSGDGKKCIKEAKSEPKNDDKDKEKKSARTKWCLGFLAGSGMIEGAESLRTNEGIQALEDAAKNPPTDVEFKNLDHQLGNSNMNVDVDKSASVPESWMNSKRDLSRRQGVISLARIAGALARVAEAATQAAKASAEAATQAAKLVGQTSLRVGGEGRAGSPKASAQEALTHASSSERASKAAKDLNTIRGSKEFRDCLAEAIPAGGMIVADATMHTEGVPEGGFKPETEPTALVLFKNEDNNRDKGSKDHYGASHYWVTYPDDYWHDNRIVPGTCQSAQELAGEVSAYAVSGGCCSFYADDKCTVPMFTASNREDMNLKGNSDNRVRAWSCVKDTGCAGVPNLDSYAHGQCGIHVIQSQAVTVGKDPISFEINVLDAAGQPIFTQPKTGVSGDLVKFKIPKLNLDMTVDITPESRQKEAGFGPADDNAKFTIGQDSFWSGNKDRCTFGIYDGVSSRSGKRQGDCGFACP